jgi:hypothetical protein
MQLVLVWLKVVLSGPAFNNLKPNTQDTAFKRMVNGLLIIILPLANLSGLTLERLKMAGC